MKSHNAMRFGAAAVAASALLSALPADAAIVVYTFLDPQDAVSLTITSDTVTSMMTLPSDFCSVPVLCSSVTFTPTASYDEVTLLNGDNFYFAPTAFTTVSANFELVSPVSANPTAEFSTLIASVPEPSTWLLMIAGFGLAGGAVRNARRRSVSPNASVA